MRESPVTVQVPLDMLREIREAMTELTQDLAVEIEVTYPEEQRQQYPSYQRKWQNDMAPVREGQRLLMEISRYCTVTDGYPMTDTIQDRLRGSLYKTPIQAAAAAHIDAQDAKIKALGGALERVAYGNVHRDTFPRVAQAALAAAKETT